MNGLEPGKAISIREWDAIAHLLNVGRGMKAVAVGKHPAQLLRQEAADGCLSGAGRAHYENNHEE